MLGDAIAQTAHNGRRCVSSEGLLIGPHDRPVINEPLGETYAVGIVTTPVGCEMTFGVRPAAIRGDVVPLCEAWAGAASLRHELASSQSAESALRIVRSHLERSGRPAIPGLGRVERAVAAVRGDPTRPIAEVAAELGISHGYLDREFTRIVGLTPRMLARLLRVRRFLLELDIDSEAAWLDRAIELGWYDQAHFIRDFKRHTGVTPTQYLAVQREVFGTRHGESGTAFVPER